MILHPLIGDEIKMPRVLSFDISDDLSIHDSVLHLDSYRVALVTDSEAK